MICESSKIPGSVWEVAAALCHSTLGLAFKAGQTDSVKLLLNWCNVLTHTTCFNQPSCAPTSHYKELKVSLSTNPRAALVHSDRKLASMYFVFLSPLFICEAEMTLLVSLINLAGYEYAARVSVGNSQLNFLLYLRVNKADQCYSSVTSFYQGTIRLYAPNDGGKGCNKQKAHARCTAWVDFKEASENCQYLHM